MTSFGLGWQLQIAVMILPTLVYGALLKTAEFPEIDKNLHSTRNNIRNLFSPLYLFLVICMTITATAELGTQQWIQEILGASGAHPMLILAMITGIMAVGRYFAGPIVHKFQPSGVLLGSAVLATLGIFLMSQVGGAGMFAVSIWNPIIGGWVDDAKATAIAQNLSGDELTLASGQALLSNLVLFPLVLIVLFVGLHVYLKRQHAIKS
jgi:hypothetical protein